MHVRYYASYVLFCATSEDHKPVLPAWDVMFNLRICTDYHARGLDTLYIYYSLVTQRGPSAPPGDQLFIDTTRWQKVYRKQLALLKREKDVPRMFSEL